MAQQVDAIAVLGDVNTQLAQLRKDKIKPEYSICSAEVPISSHYLFGDDLAKLYIILQLHLNITPLKVNSTV